MGKLQSINRICVKSSRIKEDIVGKINSRA